MLIHVIPYIPNPPPPQTHQAYKELLLSIVALQRIGSEESQALYRKLENNVCYVLEFRETILHTLMHYHEGYNTK